MNIILTSERTDQLEGTHSIYAAFLREKPGMSKDDNKIASDALRKVSP